MSQPEETREKTAKVDDVLMHDVLRDLQEMHRQEKADEEQEAADERTELRSERFS